jgi:hypothetical protein
MSDIEKELKKVLKADGRFDADKNAARRKEIEQMIVQKYETDMFKVKVVFWIFLALSLCIMAGGYIALWLVAGTRGMLTSVLLFMVGFNSTILIKLWYWVCDTKLNVLKEMKQLQLQITELKGNKQSSGN